MPTPSIVIDATPMLAASGHRGIGRYVYDLLHGLEQTRSEWEGRVDLRVVTGLGWNGGADVTGDLGGAADALRARRGTEHRGLEWKRRLLLGLHARHADLLHLSEAIGTPWIRSRCRSVTCYDLIPLRMPDVYLGGSRYRIAKQRFKDLRRYRSADRLFAISERTRRDIIEVLGVSPDKVVAIPTGIDLGHWSSESAPTDPERLRALGVGARPYVLFVGIGDQRKGVPAMLEALATVRRSLDLELVWAARLSDRDRDRIQTAAMRAGVLDRVRLLGFVPDEALGALYRGAVVNLFLSVLEGFGLPVAEAMASGCPTVVVRDSGCDEVTGDAGFVIEPGDHDGAADAIVRLARDPDERRRRGRLGLERVRRFDRREMARGYMQTWQALVGAGS